MADEFQTITTQEELNRIIEDRLARERKKYEGFEGLKADSEELKQLKAQDLPKQIADLTAKLQQRQTELEGLQTRAEAAETALLRARIAREAGLPAALADRLTGKNEAEIRKDAEALKGVLGDQPQKTAPLADLSGGGSGGAWGKVAAALRG